MHAQPLQLVVAVSSADHVIGPQDAAMTIVEYGDFECPKCKQSAGAVKLLLARYGKRIRFVFRHFPLDEIHPHALQAALVAECASGQEKFWQMHDLLFENQQHLELLRLYEYAQTLALDMGRFAAEMEAASYLQRVRDDQLSGERSGVRATPTFFVNGRIQDVSYGLSSLFDAVVDEFRMLPEVQASAAAHPRVPGSIRSAGDA